MTLGTGEECETLRVRYRAEGGEILTHELSVSFRQRVGRDVKFQCRRADAAGALETVWVVPESSILEVTLVPSEDAPTPA